MSIDRFSVNVGNEKTYAFDNEDRLQRISFKEYLGNISQYVIENISPYPFSIVNGTMILPCDDKILTSTQCCILPLIDGKIAFNVRIHNYQYNKEDPAVLVIVASPHGTSAQLLTSCAQRIYFNNCGQKASYMAERLADVRASNGNLADESMTQDEKENNVLFIFQIPLKQKEQPRPRYSGFVDCRYSGDCSFTEESCGIDHAQLSVGKSQGPWTGTSPRYVLERYARYPIRCTVQYYSVTDTDTIPDDVVEEISRQVWKLYEEAPTAEKGSLVTNSASGRLTEPIFPSKPIVSIPFFNF